MIIIPRLCTVLYGLYVLSSSWDLDLGSSRADVDSRRSGLKDRNRREDPRWWLAWLSRRWPLVLLRRSLPDSGYKSLTFSSDIDVAYYVIKSWKNYKNCFHEKIREKYFKKNSRKNREKYFFKKIVQNISWKIQEKICETLFTFMKIFHFDELFTHAKKKLWKNYFFFSWIFVCYSWNFGLSDSDYHHAIPIPMWINNLFQDFDNWDYILLMSFALFTIFRRKGKKEHGGKINFRGQSASAQWMKQFVIFHSTVF